MKSKLLLILVLGMFLVGSFGVVSAKDFVIRNQSDSSDIYFSVNGTTGNVNVPANLSAGYFVGDGRFITNISSGAINESAINYWLKSGSDLYYNEGNVGIGTGSPGAKLDIYETSNLAVSQYLRTNAGLDSSLWFSTDADGTPRTGFIGYDYSNSALNIGLGGSFDSPDMVFKGGNVGIGTTSPDSVLDVESSGAGEGIKLTGSSGNTRAQILTGGSADGNAYLNLANSSNSNTVQIHSASNSYFNGGNVGIGTTSPDSKLHLYGDTPRLIFEDSAADRLNYIQAYSADNLIYAVDDNNEGTDSYHQFKVDGTAVMTIDGNVGIGTTSPARKLHIAGGGARIVQSTDSLGNGLSVYGSGGLDYLSIYHNNANVAILQSGDETTYRDIALNPNGGNVGIGTASPGAKLEIDSGITNLIANFKSSDDRARISIQDNDTEVFINAYDNYMSLGGANSISPININIHKTTGNVGIGTTSPEHKLDVIGDGRFASGSNTGLNIIGGADAVADRYARIAFRNENTNVDWTFTQDGADGDKFKINGEGTDIMTMLYDSGNVGIGTTSPSYRLDVAGVMNGYDVLINGSSIGSSVSGQVNSTAWNSTGDKVFLANTSANVGIGTSSPGSVLNIKASGVTSTSGLRLTSSTNDNRIITLQDGFEGDRGYLAMHNASVQKVAIDAGGDSYFNGGNVGIGTASPEYQLHINGSANAKLKIEHDSNQYINYDWNSIEYFNNGEWNNYDIKVTDTSGQGTSYGKIRFFTGVTTPVERLTILNDGKMGIGTIAPQSKLNINGTVGSLAEGLTFGDGDSGIYEVGEDLIAFNSGGSLVGFFDAVYGLRGTTTGAGSLDTDSAATATVPVHTFRGDEDTGIGRAAADELSLIAGGIEVARASTTNLTVQTNLSVGGDSRMFMRGDDLVFRV